MTTTYACSPLYHLINCFLTDVANVLVIPVQAVLLNSLKRLEGFVAEMSELLTSWARTTADSPGRARPPTPLPSPTKGVMLARQNFSSPTHFTCPCFSKTKWAYALACPVQNEDVFLPCAVRSRQDSKESSRKKPF